MHGAEKTFSTDCTNPMSQRLRFVQLVHDLLELVIAGVAEGGFKKMGSIMSINMLHHTSCPRGRSKGQHLESVLFVRRNRKSQLLHDDVGKLLVKGLQV